MVFTNGDIASFKSRNKALLAQIISIKFFFDYFLETINKQSIKDILPKVNGIACDTC